MAETYSALLALLSLLLFLLLGEGILHQEFAVRRIPLCLQVRLNLLWHQHCTFESLHVRDIDVGLIFLITFSMRSCKVVTDRLDLFKLLLTDTISCILRYEVERAREFELRKRGLSLLIRRRNVLFFARCGSRWLPSWQLSQQVICSVGSVRTSCCHAAGPIVNRKRDLTLDLLRSEWIVESFRITSPGEAIDKSTDWLASRRQQRHILRNFLWSYAEQICVACPDCINALLTRCPLDSSLLRCKTVSVSFAVSRNASVHDSDLVVESLTRVCLFLVVFILALSHCNVDRTFYFRQRVLLFAGRLQCLVVSLDRIQSIDLLLDRWHGRLLLLCLRRVNDEGPLRVELSALLGVAELASRVQRGHLHVVSEISAILRVRTSGATPTRRALNVRNLITSLLLNDGLVVLAVGA